MQLIYRAKPGFRCPAPPWPARDHDEPNAAVAQAKVRSGFYRKAAEPKAAEPKADEGREE